MSYILAKSKDDAILKAGECGGAVTSIFKYLLDNGIVDGVLALRPGDDIYDGVPTFITDSEDLISTAGSSIEVVEVLREAGANVLGIASIFTYGLQKGLDRLKEANVINHSLSNFETLVNVAAEENYISKEDINKVLKFQKNPSDPSWMD